MIDDMGREQLADIRRALVQALNLADALDLIDAAKSMHGDVARSQLTEKLADALDDLDSLVHRHTPREPLLHEIGIIAEDAEDTGERRIVKRPTVKYGMRSPAVTPGMPSWSADYGMCSPVGTPGMPPISTGMPWHAGMLAEAVKRAENVIRIRSFDDWPFLDDDELFPHIADLHRQLADMGLTDIDADRQIMSVEVHSETEKRRLHFLVGNGDALARLRHLRESVTPPKIDTQQLIESRMRYGSDEPYAARLAAEYRQQGTETRQRLADAVRGDVPTPRDIAERSKKP